ncbi:MAG TPA: hypothetical protein VK838_02995, partial [Candidatus Limnocylindrales bacterium]|nr:hypothetical protein [Candidatus Limnocylindrales bacterium]
MSEDGVIAIASIPLARSRARMLLAPALLLLTAAVAAAGGVVVAGWQGIGLIAGAAVLVFVAFYLVLVVATVRLDVEVSMLRIRWLGADRRYGLVRGAVTRVPLVGEQKARLRPRFGAFGWGLGPARLRGKEQITLVRLAPSAAVILVPTDGGRVAIAPRSEEQLLEALTAAARVQQRLDEATAHVRAMPVEELVEEAPAVEPIPEVAPIEGPATRVLTGIERTLIEERLAAERARALAAAEAEQQAAEQAARLAAEAASAGAAPAISAARERGETTAPTRPPRALPRPRLSLPSAGTVTRARLASLGIAIVPLLMAVGAWGAASATGRLEMAGNELRDVSIA